VNKGKNRWVIGYLTNELWSLRLDVDNHQRMSTPQELIIYKSGFVNYWTVDFLFAVYKGEGNCISGDLKYKHGKICSNDYVLTMVENFKDSDHPLFTDEVTTQFIYLKKLYELIQDARLTQTEYNQFKRMYHAIQREEYDIVIKLLKGYEPLKIKELNSSNLKIS